MEAGAWRVGVLLIRSKPENNLLRGGGGSQTRKGRGGVVRCSVMFLAGRLAYLLRRDDGEKINHLLSAVVAFRNSRLRGEGGGGKLTPEFKGIDCSGSTSMQDSELC